MKNTKVFLFFFFLLFAVAFAIPGNMFFTEVNSAIMRDSIVKNGTEIEATVISKSSNITVNDEPIYAIKYKFEVDGQTHIGKTSTNYTSIEASKIYNRGTILIKYDKNFNSVEANYKFAGYASSTLIMFGIFALVDLAFWITEIVFVIQFIIGGLVSILGKKTTATFVSILPSCTYNGTPLYRVSYYWTAPNGEIFDGKSDKEYTLAEASVFEKAENFDILAWRDKSKVLNSPNKIMHKLNMEHQPKQVAQQIAIEEYVECEYCKSMLSSNVTRCPACGAPRKLKK